MSRPAGATIGSMTRPMTSNVLVGRREELALIDELVRALASDGSGGVLVIGGEAGVGKSRLVEALAELADGEHVQVFVGHCVQFGDEKLPAAPLIEILRDLAVRLDAEGVETVVGSARKALASLVPALGVPPTGDGPLEAQRLRDLVHGVLTRLATRGRW